MSVYNKRKIEVIFSPALFEYREIKENYITVIVDILRASTSICTAFKWGVKAIIPVKDIEKVMEFKSKGYIVAGERLEEKFSFADLGNGAYEFMNNNLKGKEIVHSSTNGTKAIEMARNANSDEILIGAFSNIDYLKDYIIKQDKNVVLLCSGWKNSFSMEDSLFCGLLALKLMESGKYINHNDSTFAAIDLWKASSGNLMDSIIIKASHIHRLRKYNMDNIFQYTFTFNTCRVLPKMYEDRLKDALVND
ncbi:MAG: 2-phosphosulfolactate phosphatase [Bacteroidales bacterium]|jgi:2-phosphosulfolactate phosphatase|nr:2-phosphosulfolactate phosphatase [Bacteroidales bacterium]